MCPKLTASGKSGVEDTRVSEPSVAPVIDNDGMRPGENNFEADGADPVHRSIAVDRKPPDINERAHGYTSSEAKSETESIPNHRDFAIR